ncbi:MAG: AAA-like domain-containing protein [Cenarchaeum symbiont of Oopsacas minuta]|nr:AAA-like domain-containing protein [Cenarchaeum symbiont of Oopsacas minuta]
MTEQRFCYEVAATDFETLPDEKKMEAMAKYLGFLRTLRNRTLITMINEPLTVQMGNENVNLVRPRTFVTSPISLETNLNGFDHHVISDREFYPIKKEQHSVVSGKSYLELDNGAFAKCFTLYGLPSQLYPAWIYNVLGYSEMISIRLTPIPHDQAVTKMRRYVNILGATKLRSPDHAYRYEKGLATMDALARQVTQLFICECNALIQANTLEDLKIREKEFRVHSAATMTKWDATPTKQRDMLSHGWGKQLYIELGSLNIFYPFASSDLIETPGGICLGINMTTGAPIVWDHTTLDSYNVLILARVGKGKSVTAKTILTRLVEAHPDSMIFIVDPKGEYPASKWNLDEIDPESDVTMGMDPFHLFSNVGDTADIIADICDVAEDDAPTRNEILAAAENSNSVAELYEKLDSDGKGAKYVQRLMATDMQKIIRGDKEFGHRTVISLKNKPSSMVSILTVLAFAKAWKSIRMAEQSCPKILIVDEGWRLFKKKNTSRIIEEIARMGRAYHAIGIFITQEPNDITTNQYGRAFANNSGLKIILGLEPDAANLTQKVLGLSDREVELIVSFSRGQALLLTKGYRIRAQIRPSADELRLFNTDPTGGKI